MNLTVACTILGQKHSAGPDYTEYTNEAFDKAYLSKNEAYCLKFKTPTIGVCKKLHVVLNVPEVRYVGNSWFVGELRTNDNLYDKSAIISSNRCILISYNPVLEWTFETEELEGNTVYYILAYNEDFEDAAVDDCCPFFGSIDTHEVTVTHTAGLAYIGNGSESEAYQCYIGNGSGWDLCIPHIGNGSSWDMYS